MTVPGREVLSFGLSEARRLLERGAADRRSAAHTPVIASIDADGAPSQRVMVLRECHWQDRLLRFHSDSRSPKVRELADASVSVLVYSPASRTQLRINGMARVQGDGEAADTAWAGAARFSRRCYLSEHAPTSLAGGPVSGLPVSMEGREPSEAELAAGRANFTLVLVEMKAIDWLCLAEEGHRRARYRWAAETWRGEWLVP